MKTFGQYLLEKHRLSDEVLLNSLIEQSEKLPSLASLVRDLQLLTQAQQLEVIQLQIENVLEYRQACTQLGHWTTEIQERVLLAISKKIKPLGTILLEHNVLSIDEFNTLLAEFVSLPQNLSAASAAPSAAALDTRLLQQYCLLFDAALYQHLLASASANDPRFEALRFTAAYCQQHVSADLWSALQSYLAGSQTPDATLLAASFNCLWAQRNALHEGSCDDRLADDKNATELLHQLRKRDLP